MLRRPCPKSSREKKGRSAWVAGPLLIFTGLAVNGAVPAEEASAASLRLTPSEIALGAGEAAQVVLLVKAGEAALLDVEVAPTQIPGLTLRPAAAKSWTIGCLQAGSSLSLEIQVERDARGGGTGIVPIGLQYRVSSGTTCPRPGSTTPSKAGAEVAGLTVTDSAARKMSSIAQLEVKSGIELIEDRRQGGMAYVIVTNLSSGPLKVTGARCYAPYFLTIRGGGEGGDRTQSFSIVRTLSRWWRSDGNGETPGSPATPSCGSGLDLPVLIEAGSSRALPFQMTADVVESGQHTVAWEIDLEWHRAGLTQSGSMVTEKVFNLGVLGESTLLQIFAWPSILVLPGALMLMTFLALGNALRKRLFSERDDSSLFASKEGKVFFRPEFWLIAIPLSLAVVIFYPWLTGKLGDPRDFMVVRGFDDIVSLWFGSMFLGALSCLAWYWTRYAIKRARAEWRAWLERRRVPQPADPPLRVLEKLRDSGASSLVLQRWEYTREGEDLQGLALMDAGEDGLWLAPPILVGCRDAALRNRLEGVRDHADKLTALIEEQKTEQDVEGKRVQVINLSWKPEPKMPRTPLKLEPGAQRKKIGAGRLVEIVAED